jgi:hypothetical protein
VTKTTRNMLVGMAIAMGTTGIARVEAANGGLGTSGTPVFMRVRTNSAVVATLIQEATQRSATFRSLVETIHVSDGIVYVNEGDCGHGVRACLADVKAAGPNRILRIQVDTRKADWDLMGSIGHELRHAVEVLGDPAITSNAAMYFFYTRTGRRGTATSFETQAAVEAGHAVRGEVRQLKVVARSE